MYYWLDILAGMGTAGIICFVWQQRQKQQIQNMLDTYCDRPVESTYFAPLSSVRRELKSLYEEKQFLTEEVEQWYQIIENAPFGYLRVDGDNQLLWCNTKTRELLLLNRWQPGQIRLLLELVRSYELDQLIEQTRRTQTAQTQQWEFYPSHDAQTPADSRGTSIHLRGSTFPMTQGDVVVFLENQEPIHLLKRSQEKLLSDLTHELRTPLTAMRLVSETLEQRLTGLEQKWSRQILKEVHRLFYLVQDWLELSRLESHPHQVLSYQRFDLVQLIQRSWEILQPIATQKTITLQYEGQVQLWMTGDGDRLTQVFINLFDNAIKYNPDGKPIIVKLTTPTPATVTVEVIDQGKGFVMDDLPYVFERLYRGDQARTRQGGEGNMRQGSGLGLAIVEQIIKAHDGAIAARNHPDYHGAWLTLTLPTELTSDDPEI